jgi:hypothetical protein
LQRNRTNKQAEWAEGAMDFLSPLIFLSVEQSKKELFMKKQSKMIIFKLHGNIVVSEGRKKQQSREKG